MKQGRLLSISAFALAASACFSTAVFAADTYRVAFMAASSQNGFNQATYDGIKKKAAELGNVEVEIFDGEFNAQKQYSQIEDIVASRKFNAMIVQPNDSVGIANAMQEAIDSGMKVATTLFPVGPKLDTIEPQLNGLTTTVASNPAIGAKGVADKVVEFCADKDPCKVVIVIGQKIFPFDNLRLTTFEKTLAEHANVKVVSTVEGNYDPQQTMAAMQDVLQAHPDVNAILANADQMAYGVELAVEDAGIDLEPIYITSGGGSEMAMKAVRDGRWDLQLALFPVTMGEKALEAVVGALEGKEVPVAIDADTMGPVPAIVDKAVLDAHPDFNGQWPG